MSHVILNQIEIPWLKFNFSKDDDANHLWALHFSSDAQLCPTLCDPMDCIMPGFPVLHQLLELLKFMSIKLVMPSNHLMLCCPVLLLPSIFPSIRVISRESLILIRWPKYWSFSFSISPSNEYSGLISFRMDWLDLLAVQGLSRVFTKTTVQNINSSVLSFLYSPTLTSMQDHWKNRSFD